jgi:hypothetical protein
MSTLNPSDSLMRLRKLSVSSLHPAWTNSLFIWWFVTLGGVVLAVWLLMLGQGSLVAGVIVFTLLWVTTMMDKAFSLPVIIAFLFLLGDIRRVIGMGVGFPQLDPLLLVGPALSFILAIPILMRLRFPDYLSRVMFYLMVVMVLEIVNPKQGSLFVGLTGAMFCLVPLLWFWIGREFGSPKLLSTLLYRVLIPLSVVAAGMGIYQTYAGFLPWQAAWVTAVASHYHALYLASGVVRSFGFSVNGIEYINLLLMGSVATLSAFFAGRRVYIFLFPLLATALFLSSSRTSIVKLLFALAMTWALRGKRGRGWIVRLGLALVVGIGGLSYSLSHLVPTQPSTPVVVRTKTSGSQESEPDAASASTQHQLQGLAHPLDKKYSTAQSHSTLFMGGLMQGIKSPIGSGLGAMSLGAGKFEGGDSDSAGSTEVDISDMFVSNGLIGGALYLVVIVLALWKCIAFSRVAPLYIGLPAMGVLTSLIGGWIATGQYALGPTVWLIIGVMSRYDFAKKTATEKRPVRSRLQPPASSTVRRPTSSVA